MPTNKHRFMIVLDEETIEKLNYIKKINGRKQTSYIIKNLIDNEYEETIKFIKELLNN